MCVRGGVLTLWALCWRSRAIPLIMAVLGLGACATHTTPEVPPKPRVAELSLRQHLKTLAAAQAQQAEQLARLHLAVSSMESAPANATPDAEKRRELAGRIEELRESARRIEGLALQTLGGDGPSARSRRSVDSAAGHAVGSPQRGAARSTSAATSYVACRTACISAGRPPFDCTQECACEAKCQAFGDPSSCATYCRPHP